MLLFVFLFLGMVSAQPHPTKPLLEDQPHKISSIAFVDGGFFFAFVSSPASPLCFSNASNNFIITFNISASYVSANNLEEIFVIFNDIIYRLPNSTTGNPIPIVGGGVGSVVAGAAALSVGLSSPTAVFFDNANTLYFVNEAVLYSVNSSGLISQIAGGGNGSIPHSVFILQSEGTFTLNSLGQVFVSTNFQIYQVDRKTNTMQFILGNANSNPDTSATETKLYGIDPLSYQLGGIYVPFVADEFNNVYWASNHQIGVITSELKTFMVAGTVNKDSFVHLQLFDDEFSTYSIDNIFLDKTDLYVSVSILHQETLQQTWNLFKISTKPLFENGSTLMPFYLEVGIAIFVFSVIVFILLAIVLQRNKEGKHKRIQCLDWALVTLFSFFLLFFGIGALFTPTLGLSVLAPDTRAVCLMTVKCFYFNVNTDIVSYVMYGMAGISLIAMFIISIVRCCSASMTHHEEKAQKKMKEFVEMKIAEIPPIAKEEAFLPSEFMLSNITIEGDLGSGNFGSVRKGMWNVTVPVALKKLFDPSQKAAFIKEAQLLHSLRHPNIVQFYGFYMEDSNFLVVLEFMNSGSVLDLLQSGKLHENSQLNSVAFQTLEGMVYLESQNVIHCDLAARNILISKGKDQLEAKVADFGLGRKIKGETYNPSQEMAVPVKWSAPEVIFESNYSHKSDVWAFGIVLWEIYSLGGVPYPGMSGKEAATKVQNGYRMPYPDNCPPILCGLMKRCWNEKVTLRPSFLEILQETKDFFQEEKKQELPHHEEPVVVAQSIEINYGNEKDQQEKKIVVDYGLPNSNEKKQEENPPSAEGTTTEPPKFVVQY